MHMHVAATYDSFKFYTTLTTVIVTLSYLLMNAEEFYASNLLYHRQLVSVYSRTPYWGKTIVDLDDKLCT